MIGFSVNGKRVDLDVDPSTPLFWVIREHLNLTGTKYGCGMAQCGACTVHINGGAVRSCVAPVSRASGQRVTTIEDLSPDLRHPLQRAWLEEDVPQCGYCQHSSCTREIRLALRPHCRRSTRWCRTKIRHHSE